MKKEKQVVRRSLIETRDIQLYFKAATNLGGTTVSIVAQSGDRCSYGGNSDTVPENYEYIRITTRGDIERYYAEVRSLRTMSHEMDGTIDPLQRKFMGPFADSPDILDNQSL